MVAKMFVNFSWLALFLLAVVLLHLPLVLSHPSRSSRYSNPSAEDYSIHDPRDTCKTNDTIEELCQRCAKSTQSYIVYPLCCKDEEDARHWCDRYLAFGIHQKEKL